MVHFYRNIKPERTLEEDRVSYILGWCIEIVSVEDCETSEKNWYQDTQWVFYILDSSGKSSRGRNDARLE